MASIQGLDNTRILNLVRANADLGYQSRVPAATQGNSRDVLRTIQSYEPDWNTFVEVFLNQCALPLYRVNSWENELSKFKRGLIRRGSWVKEVGYNLVKAHVYDKYATHVFDVEDADIRVNYHIQNRKDQYKISIADDIVDQAADDDMFLSEYANGVLGAVQTSDNIDEYNLMLAGMDEFAQSQGIFNYQVPDLSLSTDIKGDAQKITSMLRKLNLDFRFPRQVVKWNAEHLPYRSGESVLITTSDFMSRNDVYNLASAFNVEYGKFIADTVQVIDEFNPYLKSLGAQAILCDREWFVAADTKLKTASIYNPSNDATNHWLNHWGIYSYSRMAPVVLLSTAADSTWTIETGTLNQIAANFADGYTYAARGAATPIEVTATATGELTNANGASITIAPGSDVPLSTNTHIEYSGPTGYTLWVGADEQNTEIVLNGVSTVDSTKTFTFPVGIAEAAPAGTATGVTVTGATATASGGTCKLAATVTPESAPQDVAWMVANGNVGTVIRKTGALTADLEIAEDEQAESILVLAYSTDNPAYRATASVTVTH